MHRGFSLGTVCGIPFKIFPKMSFRPLKAIANEKIPQESFQHEFRKTTSRTESKPQKVRRHIISGEKADDSVIGSLSFVLFAARYAVRVGRSPYAAGPRRTT